jgi:hypothetical protein
LAFFAVVSSGPHTVIQKAGVVIGIGAVATNRATDTKELMHDLHLLIDIAALVTTFAGGLLARRLGLPPIVGYLLAGMAIGPLPPALSAMSPGSASWPSLG